MVLSWHGNAETWMRFVSSKLDVGAFQPFLTLDWAIWIACNRLVWDKKQLDPLGIVIKSQVREWWLEILRAYWLSKFFSETDDLEHAEALAAREAVEMAIRRGWRNIIHKGDCASILAKISSPYANSYFISVIASDIKSCTSFCYSFSVFHVRRSGNRVAHSLARLATVSLEGSIDPSLSVVSLLSADSSFDV
ncbi:hypothetical protein BUALT_Bualt10G0061800 [Buddleja alternifolia]|uniref:RNase H type-1 domain-containing protein n=1 Tax=Buddleja alternifolia TaxID=168488 RepID=A0AAV6X7D8_9LAMI|nr:hypothetical protein BUALT_Bualt10G0061800 [Buddleja alternifolia]